MDTAPDDEDDAPAPLPPVRRGTVGVGAGVAAGVFALGALAVVLQLQGSPEALPRDATFARLLRLATLMGGLPVVMAGGAAALFGALGGAMAAQRRSAVHGMLTGFAAFVLVAISIFLLFYLPAALVDGPGGVRALMDDALVIAGCIGVPAAIGGAVAGVWAREPS